MTAVPPVAGLTEAGLLGVWEEALDQPPALRALTLAVAAAGSRLDVGAVAGLPVGERNALLLALCERCFGPSLPCAVICPGCSESLDVAVTADELRASSANAIEERAVRAGGFELAVRALTGADLLTVDPSSPGARRALLTRCVLEARRTNGSRRRTAAERLPDDVLDAVAVRLRELDPLADLTAPLECPECGHGWQGSLDIAAHVWAEIDTYARRLVYEVTALATAFGWTEAEVLAVSPARRRMYLEASAA